jgi:hypothetical protein
MDMDRLASLKRRRQIAALGAMPASLAGEFTLGEGELAPIKVQSRQRVPGQPPGGTELTLTP